MPLDILAIFVIASIIGDWMKKALADGKVTAREGLDLITQLGDELGLPLDETLLDLTTPRPDITAVEAEASAEVTAAAEERPEVPASKGIY